MSGRGLRAGSLPIRTAVVPGDPSAGRALRNRLGAGAFLMAALLGSGCESGADGARADGSDTSTLAKRPAAYRPDQFPDIPFERLVGYRLTSEDPQIAMAIAGGSLRRLSLVFITREGDEGKPPQEELDRLSGGLAGTGWRQTGAETAKGEAHFARGAEELVVIASTAGSATTISLRLADTKH